MKQLFIFFFVLSICTFNTQAQAPSTDLQSKSELSKLKFLIGDWHGNGWRIGQDRQRHVFQQTEKIQYKLDSTLILVEGSGMSNGKKVHDALALISYDKEEKNYSFQSFLADGRKGNFTAKLKDGKFIWHINEYIKYTIFINEKGQWVEIGEMNRNDEWHQFFEMTLDKK